jgi:hypothetical protein
VVACGVIFTFDRPLSPRLISSAARSERSRLRPRTYGPRSFIRTLIERPLFTFVTLTVEPRGRVRDAAVKFFGSKLSPLLVQLPANLVSYPEAVTTCAFLAGRGRTEQGWARPDRPTNSQADARAIVKAA